MEKLCKSLPEPAYAKGIGNSTYYYDQEGTLLYTKIGGTVAWRNNNLGNLRYANSSIGSYKGSSGTFAIFTNSTQGNLALLDLLNSSRYTNKDLAAAITIYAPWVENDTQNYINTIKNKTKLDPLKELKDYSLEEKQQLANIIRVIEGYKVGTIVTSDNIKLQEVWIWYGGMCGACAAMAGVHYTIPDMPPFHKRCACSVENHIISCDDYTIN